VGICSQKWALYANCWPFSITMADAICFHQILVNLLGNAVKFTMNRSISFEIKLLEQKEDQYIFLRFIVKDTGSGLRLSITNNLLKMMGSHLIIESESGKGSTFYLDSNYAF